MDLTRYRGEGGGAPRNNLRRSEKSPGNRFVIQEHRAARFHYDLRLEIVDDKKQTSVLHSWIIPKNIPLEPEVRHLAIKVDNKHLSFLELDKRIVKGDYGEGEVLIWDKGKWGLMKGSVAEGQISFNLFGDIAKARFVMQRQENNKNQENHWLVWKSVGY